MMKEVGNLTKRTGQKDFNSINSKSRSKLISLIILLNAFLVINAFSQTPDLPKWIDQVYYVDPTNPNSGDGSYENPWKDFRVSSYYSTVWPHVGWESNNTAVLFKRGTTFGEGSPLASGIRFVGDSLYVGSYGSGPKAKLLFDNNNRGLRINGNYNTLNYLEVVNLDTTNYAEVVTIGGKSGETSPPRTSDFFSDSLVISRGFRGLVIGGLRTGHINNTVIHKLNHDGVYATNSDSLLFTGVHVYDINRDWAWTHDLNQAGGDCIQTTGYDANSRAEVVIVDNCILDHSYWGGKFALITNENDTTIVRNSIIKAQEESVGIYASRTHVENTTFIGGWRSIWSHTISKGANKLYNCVFIGPGKDHMFEGERNGQALYGTYMDVYNCTFVDWQYVFFVPGMNPNVRNSIFYNINTAYNIGYRKVDGSSNIHYNTDGSQQGGMAFYESTDLYIEQDPLFMDYSNQDFRLQPNSPAINAGDSRIYNSGSTFISNENKDNESFERGFNDYFTIKTDLNEIPRPIGDGYDIGAYEYYDDQDIIDIEVNKAPNIVLGNQPDIFEGSIHSIDASGSNDPDGDKLSYHWTLPEGFSSNSKSSSKINIIAPFINSSKEYVISLEINDGKISSTKNVSIITKPFQPDKQKIIADNLDVSDFENPNVPENLIDNDLSTRWSAPGGDQWAEFDFESPVKISHLYISFFEGQKRLSYFELLGSNNKTDWTTILDYDQSSGFSQNLELFVPQQKKADESYKYVRMMGHGNNENGWNSFNEVMIFGESAPLGISEFQYNFNLYPNPASDQIQLNITGDASAKNLKIEILDRVGRLISVTDYHSNSGTITIPVKNLDSGLYFIRLFDDMKLSETKKFIKR